MRKRTPHKDDSFYIARAKAKRARKAAANNPSNYTQANALKKYHD
jgi:hypothetical protein